MNSSLRIAIALFIFLGATSTSAAPTRLLSASFSGGCGTYVIAVAGEGLNQNQPNLVLGYNITLKPSAGEPIAITDSFAVVADKNGSFRQTFTASWHKFDIALTDKYVLSGSANLLSDLTVLSSARMTFSKTRLDCRSK